MRTMLSGRGVRDRSLSPGSRHTGPAERRRSRAPPSATHACRPVPARGRPPGLAGDREGTPFHKIQGAGMIVHSAPRRRARLAAACCAALAALTLTAAGATAAHAGTAATGSVPVVTTGGGAVRGTTAGTVNDFLGIPYAAPP